MEPCPSAIHIQWPTVATWIQWACGEGVATHGRAGCWIKTGRVGIGPLKRVLIAVAMVKGSQAEGCVRLLQPTTLTAKASTPWQQVVKMLGHAIKLFEAG